MAILKVATSLADVTSYDTAQVVTSTTAAKLAPYVPEGIQMNYINNSGGADTPDITFTFSEMTEGWVSMYLDMTDFSDNCWPHFVLAFRNSRKQDNPVAAFYKPMNMASLRFRNGNGSSYAEITPTYPTRAVHRLDIYFKTGTNGIFQAYLDNVLWINHSGNLYSNLATQGIDMITLQREGGSSEVRTLSALIIATEDTRGINMTMDYPTGQGAYNDWVGDYSFVDEVGLAGSDMVQTVSDGTKESFTFPASFNAAVSALAAISVHSVILQGNGPYQERGTQAFARIGGIDYNNGALFPASSSGKMGCSVFALNPATGLAWTSAEAKTVELGILSI